MSTRLTPAALSVALALAFQPALAQTATPADLATVVVTATRQATRTDELIADVSVLTREDILRAGHATLEQVLATLPGLEYAANGGPGTTSSLFMRGANAAHTLVLIDGVRIGSASSGDVALSRIPLELIERVEILRGPASSLYGADAIGGVVQIFTKRGADAPGFSASAGIGNRGTYAAAAGLAGGDERFSWNFQFGQSGTDGVSTLSNPASWGYNPDHDGFRNRHFGANLVWRPASGHEVGINLLHDSGLNDYDSSPIRSKFENDQDLASYSIYSRNRLAPNWTSTLRFGRSTDDSTNRVDGRATDIYRTDQDQVSWQNDIKLPVGQAIVAVEYLRQQLSSTTAYPVDERSIRSLLAGWNGRFDRHLLQFNLRRDDNSQFGGETTGYVGYGYQLTPQWRVGAAYGTAFRAPSFNQLYYPNTGWGGGNPNLKAERAKNAELSLKWERGLHNAGLVLFRNKVRDLINGWPPANVGNALLEGASFIYGGTLGGWDLAASLDLQRPRDADTDKRLARRADEQFKLRASRGDGQWRYGGEWQLVGERYENAANTVRMGGYGLVNLFADYRIDRDWSLFARANNVFDKRYELAKDYGTLGATLFVGLRYGLH
ncbi:TonB-dependent receptor [Rhodocyclaceae bacterium]